jgi:LPS-assembly protein
MRWFVLCLTLCICLSHVRLAGQQGAPVQPTPAPPAPAPAPTPTGSFFDRIEGGADRVEQVSQNHIRWIGSVELPIDNQTKISADRLDYFNDTKRLVAEGNVVFAGSEGRIAADRVEYNVDQGTGTFSVAQGMMSLGAMADRKQFGNQDADVYFFGETVEKIGAKKYRITRGGFSTCTQPTPRWQMTSHSLVLNLDDYAFARDTVLRVKGVPIMYLPIVYYPIQDSDRQTGFLLPTYNRSTIRGQGISNAFFWAIGRSHDATFFHDWFTTAGQGAGLEYRYMASPGSIGDVRLYQFNQSQATYASDGQINTVPANTSYEITSSVSHVLSRTMRARARVDYFSDLLNQQLYHQNIYQASRNRRTIEAGLTGSLGPVSTSALYQRSEVFSSSTSSTVYGSTPRVTASLAPQRLFLFRAPIYASVNSEYAYIPSRSAVDDVVVQDDSFGRLDVMPTIRVPLSRLTFLSLNTSATYRTTRYSRRAATNGSTLQDAPYVRQYSSLRSDIVGPVFTRIWDLQSGWAERLKHVIEPAFTVDFTSQISDYTSTPKTGSDVSDFVVSGSTKFTYGLTNRLFYRGRAVDGMRGQTREFVTVGIQQTYYSNPESSRYDSAYQSTMGLQRVSDLSPIALTTRISPTNLFDVNSKIEYDVSGRGLASASAGGTLNLGTTSANVNYSHTSTSDYVYGGTTLRWLGDRANVTYGVSWDITRSLVVSQNLAAAYLAQCCGLQVEFQKYNYGSGIPVSSDKRFNFGFVLAGLGTFSNFFGAFGAQ